MSYYEADYIYSLYNPDNGVELYDSLQEAERVKARWQEVVSVDGPFRHSRPGATLISAAEQAIMILDDTCSNNHSLVEHQRLRTAIADLRRGLDELINPIQAPQSQ